jgi:hypothetical protein
VKKVADDIIAKGGIAEFAQVDALNEKAILEHLEMVVRSAGR